MNPSPISKISLEGREFFIKRDDLIDPFLAGNKYRKLYTLLNTPSTTYQKIISYGGTQSNAMLAIAALCKQKGWEFEYLTKPIPQIHKHQEFGNFYNAKKLGMYHVEIDVNIYREYIASLSINADEKTFVLDQGGADRSAKEGLAVLAKEIRSEKELNIQALATPSGTGTTALFLALCMPEYIIYTVPCVGDSTYLKAQMQALHDIPNNLVILEPKKKYHFAKLYPEFLDIYNNLKKVGVEFDLLYAPSMWLTLLEQTKEKVLYIHSGGVSGNESMLQRYQAKGIM